MPFVVFDSECKPFKVAYEIKLRVFNLSGKKQRSKYYNSERRSTSVHKHVKYAATRPYELQICIKNPFV